MRLCKNYVSVRSIDNIALRCKSIRKRVKRALIWTKQNNMKERRLLLMLSLTVLLAGCNADKKNKDRESSKEHADAVHADGSFSALTQYSKTLPLDKIKMPKGFTISVYAEVPNARSMAVS